MKNFFTLLFIAVSMSAFSVSITFTVDMQGQELVKDTVYIVGDVNAWAFTPMISLGNNRYTWSTSAETGDTLAYYYITVNSWDSAGNEDWSYYTRYREYFDTLVCGDDLAYGSDRQLIVGGSDMVLNEIWAVCPGHETGISDAVAIKNEEFVFPNPSKGKINFNLASFGSNVKIQIFDSSGKLFRSEQISNVGSYSLNSGLTKGLYFINVSDGIRQKNQKLFIQ